MLVSIITPTTGAQSLRQAIESVQAQTYKKIEHYIVVDGPEHQAKVDANVHKIDLRTPTYFMTLPYPTGVNRFLGHRIYGASPFLTNGDYLVFLDEDNWLDDHHVESLVSLVTRQELQWAYSLRKIFDNDGNYVTRDDCESLGQWPSYTPKQYNLVDTNCYFLSKAVALKTAAIWYRQFRTANVLEADRYLCSVLLEHFPKFATTGLYTLNYRAGSTGDSVDLQFFLEANALAAKDHPDGFPWRAKESA